MNFATFDLNLLRVLDALLRDGSTVKAAQRLNLSQPAISSALSRLRHATGDQLFIRQGNRLRPTAFAQSVEHQVRLHLESLEDMFSAPQTFEPAEATGTFKITASDFFAEMLMPQLGDFLNKTAPNVRAQLVDLFPIDYLNSLERYNADLALIPDCDVPSWAKKQSVFHSEFVVIARRNHPGLRELGKNAEAEMPLDVFCDLGHVLFSPEGKLNAMGDAALNKVGRARKVTMTLPVFSGVCNVVGQSDLIALVPQQLAARVAPKLGLDIFLPPIDVPVPLIIGVWHKRTERQPFHAWMRQQIFELLKPLDGMRTS